MAPRGYIISLDNFCFIRGEYIIKSEQRNVSSLVKKNLLISNVSLIPKKME